MAEIVCIQCKYIGKPKKKKRGSTRMEALGWSLFPLGLPYTLWRMFSKQSICPHCDSEFVKPTNSLAGQRLVRIASAKFAPPPEPLLPMRLPDVKEVPMAELHTPPDKPLTSPPDPEEW